MLRYAKLWLTFARTCLTREMQFKANFLTSIIIEICWSLVTVLMVEVYFYNTQSLAGWNKGEVLLIYSIYRFSSSFFAIIFRKNIRVLSQLVNSGEFDFNLIRPVNIIFLTTTKLVAFNRLSQIAVSLAVFVYANQLNPINWNLQNIITLIVAIFLGVLIRFSVSLFLHTFIFWLEKLTNLERLEITFFGLARFPRDVFPAPMQFFFSYLAPVFFTAAVPAEIITNRSPLSFLLVILLVTITSLFITTNFFNFALSRYSSASS